MPRFINEIRRKDGTNYPPNTLTNIAAGIQRHLREECNRPTVNFLKKDDPTFDLFRKSLDSRMKELTNMGVGTKVNRTDPVLQQDEEQLRNSGVLNQNTAQGLSVCFFYNCKLFAFRANDEHRNLDVSQFSINYDHEPGLKYLEFKGRSCKNVQGGLKHKKVETKNIHHFEQPENKRCVVKVYEKYLSLIPYSGAFYKRPVEGNVLKFSSQVIGEEKLGGMMKNLFSEAGIIQLEGKLQIIRV
ncbi:zinc finger MYM-type protein 2-like [Saccostrea cucullata]|uniref:zinc finger MYM-type protein 2-like n=1 Tax=Saccostrea cuccullata TaxID=36930 RepID=UPI002ED2C87B